MTNYIGTQTATFRDQRGFTTTVHGTILSTVSEAALLTDCSSFVTYLNAASGAQLVRTGGVYIAPYSAGYGGATGYPDIAMKCKLQGFTAAGDKTSLAIPSPLANCFLADGFTADLATNTGIAGLVAMAAGGTLVQAKTYLAFTINGGHFVDARKRRRVIAGVKNPALTGPG